MKIRLRQSTPTQNRMWAYVYLGFAFAMAVQGIVTSIWIWYLFSSAMIGLAAFSLYWLSKRLLIKEVA